jgi:hypothetical protein
MSVLPSVAAGAMPPAGQPAAAGNPLVRDMHPGKAEKRPKPRQAGQAEGPEPSSVAQVIAARHRQGGGIAIPNWFNLL